MLSRGTLLLVAALGCSDPADLRPDLASAVESIKCMGVVDDDLTLDVSGAVWSSGAVYLSVGLELHGRWYDVSAFTRMAGDKTEPVHIGGHTFVWTRAKYPSIEVMPVPAGRGWHATGLCGPEYHPSWPGIIAERRDSAD